jgi:hypothetical protein
MRTANECRRDSSCSSSPFVDASPAFLGHEFVERFADRRWASPVCFRPAEMPVYLGAKSYKERAWTKLRYAVV